MSIAKAIEIIEHEIFNRSTKEKSIKCCKNCKWYNLREEIQDERGKHECYGHSLICSPVCLGYEIDKENICDKFEYKGDETAEEIEKQWSRKFFGSDKSTDLLENAIMKSENQ